MTFQPEQTEIRRFEVTQGLFDFPKFHWELTRLARDQRDYAGVMINGTLTIIDSVVVLGLVAGAIIFDATFTKALRSKIASLEKEARSGHEPLDLI